MYIAGKVSGDQIQRFEELSNKGNRGYIHKNILQSSYDKKYQKSMLHKILEN
jgi:hypothetical protein